jgi:hypothetical protein
MIIYTSHYDSWPMINLCSIEKPKTDISFILEKVHQEKEGEIVKFVLELSPKAQFSPWTMKTAVLVLKLSQPAQFRP